MQDKQPDSSTGLYILVPALLLCCIGPILFTSASIGGLSFLSGFGAYVSIGIAALAALAALLFIKKKNHS